MSACAPSLLLIVHPSDTSEIQGAVSNTTIPFDYLVFAVGAEVQTFNIPGVREHACFMKELEDAEKMQRHFMDCTYMMSHQGARLLTSK